MDGKWTRREGGLKRPKRGGRPLYKPPYLLTQSGKNLTTSVLIASFEKGAKLTQLSQVLKAMLRWGPNNPTCTRVRLEFFTQRLNGF